MLNAIKGFLQVWQTLDVFIFQFEILGLHICEEENQYKSLIIADQFILKAFFSSVLTLLVNRCISTRYQWKFIKMVKPQWIQQYS